MSEAVNEIKNVEEIVLDETQQLAVDLCTDMKNPIVAVTGGAGYGKTRILRNVYDILTGMGISTIAVAPTGKAARRIKEATGIDAVTIHRALEFPHPGEANATGVIENHTQPRRHRQRPLDAFAILCDEHAMVNDEIHRCLIQAMRPGAVIRFFGDCNQLRPIEENKSFIGQPSNFERILTNPKFKSVTLKKLYRTGADSIIASNARNILIGQPPRKAENYRIDYTGYPVVAIAELMKQDPIKWAGIDAQGITPTKKTWIGTEALNASLQHNVFKEVFASTEKYLPLERHKWTKQPLTLYVGDKIIITANNYGLGLFNGDIGKVVDLDPVSETIFAEFYGDVITIPSTQMIMMYGSARYFNPQKDIDLGYMITAHKTQGSEWKETAYVMNRSCSFMCNRRNLYTGNTRPREIANIIADSTSMSASLYKKGD